MLIVDMVLKWICCGEETSSVAGGDDGDDAVGVGGSEKRQERELCFAMGGNSGLAWDRR